MKRIFDLSPAAAIVAVLCGGPALAADAPPVAAAAHLVDDGERARLSFDLSAPVAGRAREIESPDRIVLDMPEVDFRLSASVGRVVAREGGRHRQSVPVRVVRSRQVARRRSIWRARLASSGSTRAGWRANAAASRMTLEMKPAPAKPSPRPRRIMRRRGPPTAPDAVAGAEQARIAGDRRSIPAMAASTAAPIGLDGAVEKTLVYAFADALRAKLEATGRYRVVMTRTATNMSRWRIASPRRARSECVAVRLRSTPTR